MKINNDLTVSLEFLEEFQRKIGIRFNNPSFLIEALLHTSFFNGDKIKMDIFKQKNLLRNESYEKLEYLGDSVLGNIISEHLYWDKGIEDYAKKKCKTIECVLTEIRQVLVQNKNLVPLARKINLEKYIFQQGLENVEDLYANVVEAIIGATFCDQEYPEAKRFVYSFFDIKGAFGKIDYLNPKGRLKELSDKMSWDLKYDPNEAGPDHNKRFTVALLIDGKQVSVGEGSTKKDAEADAANKYLQSLDVK